MGIFDIFKAKQKDLSFKDSYNEQMGLSDKGITKTDGWHNLLTGLQQGNFDKATYAVPVWNRLHYEEAAAIYDSDKIARRIVDYIVDAALFHNFSFSFNEKDEQENLDINQKIIRELNEKYDVHSLISRSAKFGRVYGGAYILIGVEDGLKPTDPLDKNRIRSVKFLRPFDPYEIFPTVLSLNPASKNYLQPEYYTIATYGGSYITQIHHSRIIRFDGDMLSRRNFVYNGYVHDSIFNALKPILSNYHQSIAAVGALLQEFSIGIYKIQGLKGLMSVKKEDQILRRLSIIDRTKSINRSIALDAEESYERQSAQAGGIAEMVTTLKQELATQVDMPHTILFNEGPNSGTHGLGGSKGESELSDWQAKVSEYQKYVLKGKIKDLYDVLFSAKDNPITKGKIPIYDIQFQASRAMNMKEESEAMKTIAEVDQTYLDMGVISRKEIRARFQPYGLFDRYESKVQIEGDEPPEQENPMAQMQGGEEKGEGGAENKETMEQEEVKENEDLENNPQNLEPSSKDKLKKQEDEK